MSLALASRRAAISPAWVKNPLWRTARAVPSLDHPFADTKSLVDAVTGQSLVTFTRASSGTSVGSDGLLRTAAVNEPRFDHNPTTGESLGLLVEEQRTNLLLRSEEFDNASWVNGNTTELANVLSAPNGTLTADKIIENAGAGFKSIEQATTVSALTYTLSVYAKAAERSIVQLLWSGGASTNFANFNLSTGTITAGTYTSATITPAGSDWFRLSITSALAAGSYSGIISLQTNASATRAGSYTGDGTSGIYLWGAQLEAGSFPTSYIPTTTATATRSADVASITGTAFSSWYSQSEGTIFFNGINPATNTTGFAVSDGSIDNRLQMATGTNSRIARVVSGGITQAANGTAYTYGTSQRFALSYVINSINFANAGVLGTEVTSATIPTVNQMRIGANPTGGSPLNSTIKQIVFWPQRLPNSTLQAITQ